MILLQIVLMVDRRVLVMAYLKFEFYHPKFSNTNMLEEVICPLPDLII